MSCNAQQDRRRRHPRARRHRARVRVRQVTRAVMSEAVDPSSRGDDGAPSVGARVQLHSLLRTPEHNGAEGEVVEFDASTGRWRVRLAGPDGRELALRASNLAVLMPASQTLLALGEMPCGADVEMHSLVRSPELNGGRGKVVEPQDPGTGRCGVKIDSDGRVLALKPANLARLCGNAVCGKALAPPCCSACAHAQTRGIRGRGAGSRAGVGHSVCKSACKSAWRWCGCRLLIQIV